MSHLRLSRVLFLGNMHPCSSKLVDDDMRLLNLLSPFEGVLITRWDVGDIQRMNGYDTNSGDWLVPERLEIEFFILEVNTYDEWV